MIFGWGKKAKQGAAQLKAASIRMEKKEAVEATIAVMIGGMYADGKVTDQEQEQFAGQLEHNEIFAGYPAAEIGAVSDRVFGYYKLGAIMGEKKVLDEIRDLAGDKESSVNVCTVLYSMLVSDTPEGEEPKLEGKELAYFDKVSKILGVTLKEITG
jgi:tellurite resistance protein